MFQGNSSLHLYLEDARKVGFKRFVITKLIGIVYYSLVLPSPKGATYHNIGRKPYEKVDKVSNTQP